MNLEGRQRGAADGSGLVRPGRRFSLVTSELDMGPRTALVDRLPRIEGDRVDAHMNAGRGCVPGLAELVVGAPVIYDPALPPGGPRSRWMPLAREWLGLLQGDLEVLAAPASEGRLHDLTGLGPGSTPAGDDFLTGFIVGCVWTGRPRPPMPDPSRTTWLSAEILRDAAEGLVWRRGRDAGRPCGRRTRGAARGGGRDDQLGKLLREGVAGRTGRCARRRKRFARKEDDAVTSANQRLEVVSRTYYDSVTLMLVARELLKLDGVAEASLNMGTEANFKIMQAGGFDLAGVEATPNDLVIAIKSDPAAGEAVLTMPSPRRRSTANPPGARWNPAGTTGRRASTAPCRCCRTPTSRWSRSRGDTRATWRCSA